MRNRRDTEIRLCSLLLIFLGQSALAGPRHGPFPGFHEIIERADAIAVVKFLGLAPRDRPTVKTDDSSLHWEFEAGKTVKIGDYSRYTASVRKVLKGDLKEGQQTVIMFRERPLITYEGGEKKWVMPFHGSVQYSTMLLFLSITPGGDTPTLYRNLNCAGAYVRLPAVIKADEDVVPADVKSRVRALIREAVEARRAETDLLSDWFLGNGGESQSGSRGSLAPSPHTTERAGLHSAVH